jgi:nucleoside-diphosphate-sugar epimerase
MKIVVAGGSGQLGQHVVSELSANGYEVLNLDRRPHPGGFAPTWTVDLTKPGALYQAMAGADAVVHLAAYGGPDLTDDCSTFSGNVSVTYNVLKAARDFGLRRVVIAGSHAVYGFRHGLIEQTPDYLPIDEDHPCRPNDAYGLSKLVGEKVADSFALLGLSIATLRFPGINFDPTYQRLKLRTKEPGRWRSGFWSFIDVRDAATACRLALEAQIEGHRVFNLGAPISTMPDPTAELIRRFFPTVSDIRGDSKTNWSGLNSKRAERELCFKAVFGGAL